MMLLTMDTAANKKWSVLTLLFLIPVFLIALFIIHFGINTPFRDDWELVPIFQHLHAGHFFWSDFWQQHNEHRLLFPNISLTMLAYATRWNLIIISLASLFVATGSFILLTKMMPESNDSKKSEMLLLFLLALVWFSPLQEENWLWGWQIEWFMNVLGVVIVTYGIGRIKDGFVTNSSMALLLGGGLLAQYSLGNGTLIWPIILGSLIYLRVEAVKVALVATFGVSSTWLYYYQYVGKGEPSKTLAAHQPIQFTEYVVGYLGRPLSFLYKPAMALGFLLLTVFLTLSIFLLVKQRTMFKDSLPWIIIGLYAIGSALITGLARLGFGTGAAYESRYSTISSLLLVSVIILCWQNREALQRLLGDTYKVLVPFAVLGLFCLVIIEWGWGINAANIRHTKLENVQKCTSVSQPPNSCLTHTYPNPAIVTPRLQYIKSIHWGGY